MVMNEHFSLDNILTYFLVFCIFLVLRLIYTTIKDSLIFHLEMDEELQSAALFKKIILIFMAPFTKLQNNFQIISFKGVNKKLFNDTVQYYVDFLERTTGDKFNDRYLKYTDLLRDKPEKIYSNLLETVFFKMSIVNYEDKKFQNYKYEKYLIPQNKRFSKILIRCFIVATSSVIGYMLYITYILK